MNDKYDEKALLLGLHIGNATLNDRGGEFIQDLMAQALREASAEAWKEATQLVYEHTKMKRVGGVDVDLVCLMDDQTKALREEKS